MQNWIYLTDQVSTLSSCTFHIFLPGKNLFLVLLTFLVLKSHTNGLSFVIHSSLFTKHTFQKLTLVSLYQSTIYLTFSLTRHICDQVSCPLLKEYIPYGHIHSCIKPKNALLFPIPNCHVDPHSLLYFFQLDHWSFVLMTTISFYPNFLTILM